MANLKNYGLLAIAGVFAYYFFFMNDSGNQSADLGQVLDRSVIAMDNFHGYVEKNNITELADKDMNQFNDYLGSVMNSEPRFYDKTIGTSLEKDASFLGFDDKNGNGIQDEGEEPIFKVEIDGENKRLIASDPENNSSHTGFSGGGFLAGILLGNLLNRQRGAGIAPNSFNDRKSTARSSYKAPSSARSRARSGGLFGGK